MDHDSLSSVDQENIKSDLECDTYDSSEEENIDRYLDLEKLGRHSLDASFVDSDNSEESSSDSEDDSYISSTSIEKENSDDSKYDSSVKDSQSSPESLAHFSTKMYTLLGPTWDSYVMYQKNVQSAQLNECPSMAPKNFETEEKFVSESIYHSSNETNSIIYQDNKNSGSQLNKDRQEDHKSTTSESCPRHNSNHYSGVSNRVQLSALPSKNDSNENTIYASHPVFLNSDSQDLKKTVADNDMLKLQVRNYQELNLRLEKENSFLKNFIEELEMLSKKEEKLTNFIKDTLEWKITKINEIRKREIKETEEKCKNAEQVRIDEITQEHAEAHKNLKTISSKYEDEIAKLKEQISVETLVLDDVENQLFSVYKENNLLKAKINSELEGQLKTMERLMSVEDEVQSLRRENQFLKEEAEQLKEVSHKLAKAEERAKAFESHNTKYRVILSIFMFLFIMFYC